MRDLVLGRAGRRPGPADRPGPHATGRAGHALPADLRAGDGQGRRGHRGLPLGPARLAQRGRWRPVAGSGCRPRSCTRSPPSSCRRHPTGHDDALDPRHQAVGGRPRPAGRRRPSSVPTGPSWSARCTRPAPAIARPRSTAGSSCWSGRPWSAPARSRGERLIPYVEKAIREAKLHTTWTTPDAAYEDAVRDFVERRPAGRGGARTWCASWGRLDRRAGARRRRSGQKLLQLVLPGVPDVYQGCESLSPDAGRPGQPAAGRPRGAGRDPGRTGCRTPTCRRWISPAPSCW